MLGAIQGSGAALTDFFDQVVAAADRLADQLIAIGAVHGLPTGRAVQGFAGIAGAAARAFDGGHQDPLGAEGKVGRQKARPDSERASIANGPDERFTAGCMSGWTPALRLR